MEEKRQGGGIEPGDEAGAEQRGIGPAAPLRSGREAGAVAPGKTAPSTETWGDGTGAEKQGTGPETPPRSGRKRRRRAAFLCLGAVVLLALIGWFSVSSRWGLFGRPAYFWAETPPVRDEEVRREYGGAEYRYNTDIINVLVLGIDKPIGEQPNLAGASADTVLLFSFNTKTGAVDVLAIPRDLEVPVLVAGMRDELIRREYAPLCTQYWYGTSVEKSGQLMRYTVSALLEGVPVHRVAVVDFGLVSAITDHVGGVTVQLPQDFFHTAQMPRGGLLTLDGEMAELFVRGRQLPGMVGNDRKRMDRQGIYLYALMDVVLPQIKQNPAYALGLYDAAASYIYTDMGLREMAYLGVRGLRAGRNIERHAITIENIEIEGITIEEFIAAYAREQFWLLAEG